MALNPQLGANGVPIVAGEETFLLRRDGMTFEAKEKTLGKFPGKGSLFLTTKSLFFVAAKPKLVRGIQVSSVSRAVQGRGVEKFTGYIRGELPLRPMPAGRRRR